ncbi:TIM barrel protein [Egibacter rhizosphaerae]|nr:TIM barrel protein [Egibacter rhizosphaerae]
MTPTSPPRRVGAHVPAASAARQVRLQDADVAQVFLASPRAWRPPADDAHPHLRDLPVPVVAHASYLCNPASGDPEVRRKTREVVVASLRTADALALDGVVVHGGHVTAGAADEVGSRGWTELLRAVADVRTRTPLLIENTGNGDRAMARTLEQLAHLWGLVDASDVPVGFCLDTCHTFAGDPAFIHDPESWLRGLLDIVGTVQLVHVNGSAAPAGSRQDRHANLAAPANLLPDELIAVQLAAADGAPAVVETPGDARARADDIAYVRDLEARFGLADPRGVHSGTAHDRVTRE